MTGLAGLISGQIQDSRVLVSLSDSDCHSFNTLGNLGKAAVCLHEAGWRKDGRDGKKRKKPCLGLYLQVSVVCRLILTVIDVVFGALSPRR